jgi:predicted nuclease of predicted toxin-antitoxin system
MEGYQDFFTAAARNKKILITADADLIERQLPQ